MFSSVLFRKIFLSIFAVVLVHAVAIYGFSVPNIRKAMYESDEESAKAILDNVYNLLRSEHMGIRAYRDSALDFHKKQLRNIVLFQESFLNNKYRRFEQGLASEDEAKSSALEAMRHFRYGDNDYVWIANYDSVLISHPDPDLHNADFSQVRDIQGNLIVPPAVRTARENGEGYTRYWWQRLGRDAPAEKLTFAKDFPRWEWVMGSGVYIDDVEKKVERRKERMLGELRELLRRVRIARTGYMYVFDSQMNMIIHPNSNIEGTNFSDLLNPVTGKPIGEELIGAALGGEGRLLYKWDRPDDKGRYVYEKIAWVRYFGEFDWYIASSIYTEELSATSDMLAGRILLVSAGMFLFSVAAASVFLNRLLVPVRELSEMALRVREGDLSVRHRRGGEGEIAVLGAAFDDMLVRVENNIGELDEKVRERTRELTQANEQLLTEIEERKLVENALRESEERYRTILENIEDGYYEADTKGNMVFFNDSLCRHLGYAREELTSLNFRRLMEPRTVRKVVRIFRASFETGRSAKVLDLKLVRKDGSLAYTEISASLIRNADGLPVGFRGIARDVGERKKAEKELAYLAYHDTLTGLYNRKAFLEQLDVALAQSGRRGKETVLLYIDLDRFKAVNDNYGHETGDRLLTEVADRLRKAVRRTDRVCRVGGDEFTVILNTAGDVSPEQLAERIGRKIAAPYHIGEHEIGFVTSSIGISTYPKDADNSDTLVRRADTAMYRAKIRGDRHVRYECVMRNA